MKRKYSTGGKDAAKSLNNALHILGFNPTDLSAMETILSLSAKANCDAIAQWIAPVIADAFLSTKKLSSGRYSTACAAMDRVAELAIEFDNDTGALDILRAHIAIADLWAHHYPNSTDPPKVRSDATGKLTIARGRFDTASDFTESLKNGEAQQEIQDREKRVHTDTRALELIENARRDWEENPSVVNKLLTLVDLLARTGSEQDENDAIKLLEREYESSEDYALKQKADDYRIRQSSRRRRELVARCKADPENVELRQRIRDHDKNQNKLEMRIFEGRLKHYPTDLKIKFELGKRHFKARQFDDAIPLFQQARSDARIRPDSRLYMGMCFYHKEFFAQAIDVLRQGVDELESRGGSTALNLNYWLARTLEESGDLEEARKTYGHLIQLDYNFKDARERLERLVSEGKS